LQEESELEKKAKNDELRISSEKQTEPIQADSSETKTHESTEAVIIEEMMSEYSNNFETTSTYLIEEPPIVIEKEEEKEELSRRNDECVRFISESPESFPEKKPGEAKIEDDSDVEIKMTDKELVSGKDEGLGDSSIQEQPIVEGQICEEGINEKKEEELISQNDECGILGSPEIFIDKKSDEVKVEYDSNVEMKAVDKALVSGKDEKQQDVNLQISEEEKKISEISDLKQSPIASEVEGQTKEVVVVKVSVETNQGSEHNMPDLIDFGVSKNEKRETGNAGPDQSNSTSPDSIDTKVLSFSSLVFRLRFLTFMFCMSLAFYSYVLTK
jgi:hypothetical protein